MNTQINLRLPQKILVSAKSYSEEHGFRSIQDFIKETLREKLFPETTISKKELMLVKKLIQATNEKGLWKSEDELFKALNR